MGTLYLTETGSVARRESGRIIVTNKTQELVNVPINQVESVIIFPGVHITTSLTASWLAQGVPVTYLSNRGTYYGRLEPLRCVNVERQLKQVACLNDPNFCLQLSKSIIYAKVRNTTTILREFARHHDSIGYDEISETMSRHLRKIEQAQTIQSLIGYEGMASKDHFSYINRLIRSDFKFRGRSRNPPRDPFNSMLSFGYTLLLFDLYTLIAAHGLHPYFGFLHKPRNGHAALASDLMEEWRPILVDAFVIHLANRNTFHADDFESDQYGGVYMNHEQAKLFIRRYEERVKRVRQGANGLPEFNYRIHLENQVKMLAKAVDEHDPSKYIAYRLQ